MPARQLLAIAVIFMVFGLGFVGLSQFEPTTTETQAESFELGAAGHDLDTPPNATDVDGLELVDGNNSRLIEGIDYEFDEQNATVTATANSTAAGEDVRAEYDVEVPDATSETFAAVLATFGPVMISLVVIPLVFLLGRVVFG